MTQPARALARAAVLVLAATTLAAAAPAALTAQPPQGAQGGGRGGAAMQAMMFEGITLTDAQKTQIDSIRTAFRAQGGGGQGGGQRTAGGAPPDSAAMAARRERTQAERTAIRAVLTAEQQPVFDKNLQTMEERMREMRAQRGAPPR
jgi:Spy/CpxP family protein refolding chaperone